MKKTNREVTRKFAAALICAMGVLGSPFIATVSAKETLHFPMNEGEGHTITNMVSKQQTGLLMNTPTWYGGKGRTGLRFNQKEFQWAELNTTIDLGTDDFTLALWVEVDTLEPDGAGIVNLRNPSKLNLGVQLTTHTKSGTSSRGVRALIDFGAFESSVTGKLSRSGWRHIAVTVDRQSKMILYIDGEAVDSINIAIDQQGKSLGSQMLHFARDHGSKYYDGSIDDFRMFDKALSAVEVAALKEEDLGVGVGYDKDRGGGDNPNDSEYAGGKVYYVDPNNGNDSNNGAINSPWQTINHAIRSASYGDTVFMRKGVYKELVNINNDIKTRRGSPGKDRRFVLRSYPGEWAIIDGSHSEPRDIVFRFINEKWSVLKNFEIRNTRAERHNKSVTGGLSLTGTTDTIIENVFSHGHHGSGFGGKRQKRNVYRFCTAEDNFDEFTAGDSGGDADGFSLGGTADPSGDNQYFRCVANQNSDDGYDSWGSIRNSYTQCIASNNGLNKGNGQGFKGGGGNKGPEAPNDGSNAYRDSIAFGNRKWGFTTNSGTYHRGGNIYESNTAYNNGRGGFEIYPPSTSWCKPIMTGACVELGEAHSLARHILTNNQSFSNSLKDDIVPPVEE